MCKIKTRKHERERERETKKEQEIVLYYSIWQQPTTRLQESVYILTDLGQLPFTLFTDIA